MTLKEFWNDAVWSKVIAAFIGIALTTAWNKRSSFTPFGRPKLRKTEAYGSDQSSDPEVTYKLKYYLEAVNDTRKCLVVRVSDYKPNAVTLQKFVPGTLQVMLGKNWCPRPDSTDIVALLPNQRCRAWIGVDAKKFTKADLDKLEGKIGTLILTANGKEIPFGL